MGKNQNIAFELIEGIILVPGSINGTVGHFAFDTGATKTTLNQAYCNGSDQTDGKEVIVFDNNVNNQKTSTINSVSVDFGGTAHDLSNVRIMDMSYVETPLRTIKPELCFLGSIGADLICREKLLVDYINSYIVMGASSFPDTAKKVKLYVDRLPIIELVLQGKSFRFILDTGANHFLMDHSVAPMDQMIPSPDGTGTFLIPSISFAGSEYQNVAGLITDLTSIRKKIPADGIIGYQLLKNYICGFDFEEDYLYLWQ